jgi:CBS domain-containing protein
MVQGILLSLLKWFNSVSLEEPIEKIIVRKVYTIGLESQVMAAASRMVKKDVSCLIISRDDKAFGVISERDILRKVIAVGKDPRKVRVADVISIALVAVTINTSIGEAARKMIDNKVKRLVVVDENRSLVGIVTMTDLINWLAKQEKLSESLMNYLMYHVA